MAITFEKSPLEWNNSGVEPSADLKTNGFSPGYKPAADTFNYQINNSSACLTELQTKLSGVDDDVTALEGTVTNLDQTAVRGIRGSGTLITPMSDKTVNVTPANIGAAKSTHTHSASDITSGTLPIARGGTGATIATEARRNLDVMHAAYLYDNAEGTTGTVTLSDSAANYQILEIYYRAIIYGICSSRIAGPEGNNGLLTAIHMHNNAEWLKGTTVSISGATITPISYVTGWANNGDPLSSEALNNIYIIRVIGYTY